MDFSGTPSTHHRALAAVAHLSTAVQRMTHPRLPSSWEKLPSYLPRSIVHLCAVVSAVRTADDAAKQPSGAPGYTSFLVGLDECKTPVVLTAASSAVDAVSFADPIPHLLLLHEPHPGTAGPFIGTVSLLSRFVAPRSLSVPRPPHRTGVSVCRGGPKHARLHLPVAPPQRGHRRISGEMEIALWQPTAHSARRASSVLCACFPGVN